MDSKQRATELFACLGRGDVPAVLDRIADDATWWIAGKPDARSGGGVYTKEQIGRLFRGMLRQLEDGLRFTVKSAIAEGDEVALEVESLGTLRNGRVYANEYHFRMTFQDGKVAEVREYLDTQHAHAVWFAP